MLPGQRRAPTTRSMELLATTHSAASVADCLMAEEEASSPPPPQPPPPAPHEEEEESENAMTSEPETEPEPLVSVFIEETEEVDEEEEEEVTEDPDDELTKVLEYDIIKFYPDTTSMKTSKAAAKQAAASEPAVNGKRASVKPRFQPTVKRAVNEQFPCPELLEEELTELEESSSSGAVKLQKMQKIDGGVYSSSRMTTLLTNNSLSHHQYRSPTKRRELGAKLQAEEDSSSDSDKSLEAKPSQTQLGHSAAPNASSSASTPCSSLGVNMRVTGQCSQGGRKYMEDQFSVAYQESPATRELEYAFFGIYDGHGGTEAALFAKEHLMLEIVKQKLFWSDNDEDVLRAIREGYIATHFAMWREQEKWPRTANGHLSTAGTTATIAFMRREKIYIGHVGDSGIVLGYQNENEKLWRAKQLTTDHKPESATEKMRIQRAGGNVTVKSGVPRVVWNRPRDPFHRGPIKLRTPVDDIPFLAVARSLGDLWSYNSRYNEFVVSPDPEVKVVKINPKTFRCLIFGTDGLWNVVTAQESVDCVREKHIIGECLREQDVMNPSKALVDRALRTWAAKKMRADNTSVVTVILTPASASSGSATELASPHCSVAENLCSSGTEVPKIKEYTHDTPYSALAKRHLPPEAYRNFDYFELLEDEEDEEEEVEEDDIDSDDGTCHSGTQAYFEAERVQHSLLTHTKLWRRVRNETRDLRLPWQTTELSTSTSNTSGNHLMLASRRELTNLQSLVQGVDLEEDLDVAEDDEDLLEDEDEAIVTDLLNPNASDMDMYEDCYLGGSSSGTMASTSTRALNHITAAAADSNSNELAELEQHLEHSFSGYGVTAATATDYSFAESYNSLLNQQQAARTRSAAAAVAAAASVAAAAAASNSAQSTPSPASANHMQEILQEQQRYQQQEGYSLTRLETRREQEQSASAATAYETAATSQPRVPAGESWHQGSTEYVVEPQPAELLELDALLQQERAEEQQVALELKQQQQRLLAEQQQMPFEGEAVDANTDEDEATSSSQADYEEIIAAEWTHNGTTAAAAPTPMSVEEPATSENVDGEEEELTLQDNEVSSTLSSTPTPLKPSAAEEASEALVNKSLSTAAMEFQKTVAAIRQEDAHAVHYIFEQIQKLQEVDCNHPHNTSAMEEAIERAAAVAEELQSSSSSSADPLIGRFRQMRRYRNVPNENHHHHRNHLYQQQPQQQQQQQSQQQAPMQTRRYHKFKHTKAKSFINSSAAAIVAYSGMESAAASVASSSSNAPVSSSSRRTGGSGPTSNSGGSSNLMMMTRRSHSSSSSSSSVSKRQLRSSICSMDLTKRTLRTRNVPSTPSESSRTSNNNGSGGSSSKTSTFLRPPPNLAPSTRRNPQAPNSASSSGTSGSSNSSNTPVKHMRLRRCHEAGGGVGGPGQAPQHLSARAVVEQRRSLRRSNHTGSSGLGTSSSGGGHVPGGGNSNHFSKPTRLHSSSGGISARPPPSPKKLNNLSSGPQMPSNSLGIGTRAYTAAMAAASDLNKRWSLRSSSHTRGTASTSGRNRNDLPLGPGGSLLTAMSCYGGGNTNTTGPRTRFTTRKR